MTVDKSWPDRAIAVLTLKLSAALAKSIRGTTANADPVCGSRSPITL